VVLILVRWDKVIELDFIQDNLEPNFNFRNNAVAQLTRSSLKEKAKLFYPSANRNRL